jgi:hypothetical protein
MVVGEAEHPVAVREVTVGNAQWPADQVQVHRVLVVLHPHGVEAKDAQRRVMLLKSHPHPAMIDFDIEVHQPLDVDNDRFPPRADQRVLGAELAVEQAEL